MTHQDVKAPIIHVHIIYKPNKTQRPGILDAVHIRSARDIRITRSRTLMDEARHKRFAMGHHVAWYPLGLAPSSKLQIRPTRTKQNQAKNKKKEDRTPLTPPMYSVHGNSTTQRYIYADRRKGIRRGIKKKSRGMEIQPIKKSQMQQMEGNISTTAAIPKIDVIVVRSSNPRC